MADRNMSPEKRLLKLIEGRQSADPRPTPGQLGRKIFSLASLRARLSFWRGRLTNKQAAGADATAEPVDLKRVNMVLVFLIVLLALGLVISATIEYDRIHNGVVVDIKTPDTAQAEPVEVVSLLQPLSAYREKATLRDVFSLADVQKQEPEKPFNDTPAENSRIVGMSSNLKLVGISWSDDPDAIIEDVRAKKTYFVKKGYMIDEIKVHKILKDRVVLKYLTEEVELR